MQETVYVYKKGNARSEIGIRNVRKRIESAFPSELEYLNDRRVRTYMHARELVDGTYAELNEQHLDASLSALARFTSTKLPVTILVQADINAYTYKLSSYTSHRQVTIYSKECPNFKSTIKLIVNRFTEHEASVDRRLTYDFDVLKSWAPPNTTLTVFVADTDSFDFEIIRQLISQMQGYKPYLQLHLCLNINIPLTLFEENLDEKSIVNSEFQYLTGSVSAQELVESIIPQFKEIGVLLDLHLINKLSCLEIRECVKQLRYCTLAHFAGNPFAVVNSIDELHTIKDADKLKSVQTDPNIDFEDIEELKIGGKVLDSVFNPHYRPLIEQSLTHIEKYTSVSDPRVENVPIACLYMLQRESSVFINIYDLYMSFKQLIKPFGPEDEWDKQSMALFLESVASLKLLGIIRDCKRKFECVEKVSWTGV